VVTAIVALADYNLPVSALKDSGTAVRALEVLSEIFPAWNEALMIHEHIPTLLSHIRAHVKGSETKHSDSDLISVPD
jgi:hypothetical protein